MDQNKLESLQKEIFSEKYPTEVQNSLDIFNNVVNTLISSLNEIQLPREFNELSKNKQAKIYSYQCLSVENTIKEIKKEFIKSQTVISDINNLERFKQYTDYNKKIALLRKRNIRFYTLQFLFSQAEDYRKLQQDYISEVEENKLLDCVIFDVDKISDNLLIQF
jgi:hypothetical protein